MDRHGDQNKFFLSEQSKSFSLGSHSSRKSEWSDHQGVAASPSDGNSNFRSRFHSFSHFRKNENIRQNKNWRQWKSYADGQPKPTTARLSYHPNTTVLPQHQEQSESPSSDSSDNHESSDRVHAVEPSGVDSGYVADVSHESSDKSEQPCTIHQHVSTSMEDLARLVSKERNEGPLHGGENDNARCGGGGGEGGVSDSGNDIGMRMGLLFTDAAHTVLER
jgi:hypothetical protein